MKRALENRQLPIDLNVAGTSLKACTPALDRVDTFDAEPVSSSGVYDVLEKARGEYVCARAEQKAIDAPRFFGCAPRLPEGAGLRGFSSSGSAPALNATRYSLNPFLKAPNRGKLILGAARIVGRRGRADIAPAGSRPLRSRGF